MVKQLWAQNIPEANIFELMILVMIIVFRVVLGQGFTHCYFFPFI